MRRIDPFRILAFSLVLAVAAFALATSNARGGENLSARAAAASITAGDLRRHAEVLADDTFEGREAGTAAAARPPAICSASSSGIRSRAPAHRAATIRSFGADYRNLLAMIEGSDPKLKDEVILVSAHYDHVGYGNYRNSFGPTGYIHNGADDNASGVSTLLEVVEAAAMLDPRPKRSILFAFWDGEEKGLLGSKHWTSNPTVPLARVRTMVNMDMVGRLRNNRLEVSGTRTASNLRQLVSRHNDGANLLLDFTWEMKDNSDHYPFYSRGMPIVMLHTGLHSDYHRPSDDVDKLEFEGMRRVATLVFGVVSGLADEEKLPGFRGTVRRESSYWQQTVEAPLAPLPSRLGISWDPRDAAAPGLRVTRVVRGSAADAAGLTVGDRLVRFAGRELSPSEDFTALVLSSASPVQATIIAQR